MDQNSHSSSFISPLGDAVFLLFYLVLRSFSFLDRNSLTTFGPTIAIECILPAEIDLISSFAAWLIWISKGLYVKDGSSLVFLLNAN